jgi:hypothetical protein
VSRAARLGCSSDLTAFVRASPSASVMSEISCNDNIPSGVVCYSPSHKASLICRSAKVAATGRSLVELIVVVAVQIIDHLTRPSLAGRAGTHYIPGRALRLPLALPRDRHPPAPSCPPSGTVELAEKPQTCNSESLPCVSSAERGTRPKDSSRETQEWFRC